MTQTASAIKRLRDTLTTATSQFYRVTPLIDDAYRIVPRSYLEEEPSFSALTLMAITHGNEVGGIGVLQKLAEQLLGDHLWFPYPLQLILGNPAAALEDRRFVDRDLNRSFSLTGSSDALEAGRAAALQPLLEGTRFLLDIHQTIEPSSTPFFIFPYEPAAYRFARDIAADIPIVTHWGGGFSQDGACTDEFVNRHGGCGISIELGQKGFSFTQEAIGLYAALRAMTVVANTLQNKVNRRSPVAAPVYTWAAVLPTPSSAASLDEGWYNFQTVEKDQRLGEAEGVAIVAPTAGPLLFPKYRRPESGGQLPPEICRILKEVSETELGRQP